MTKVTFLINNFKYNIYVICEHTDTVVCVQVTTGLLGYILQVKRGALMVAKAYFWQHVATGVLRWGVQA